jgi:hypothetical protein
MDEGRKRVIGIMAAILASLHMQSVDMHLPGRRELAIDRVPKKGRIVAVRV